MNHDAITNLSGLNDEMLRMDPGKGAYQLNLAEFTNIFQFVHRIIERNGHDVQMLLFTARAGNEMDEAEIARAVDKLEEAICTSLRRSDVSARYSGRQIAAILMNTNADHEDIAVRRILECYQRLNPGSDVVITFEAAKIESRMEGHPSGADVLELKKTILVIDDDKTNLVSAKHALDELYKVVAVPSGRQAIHYLEHNICDLILLDINMPEMDGFETMGKIRGMRHRDHIPIIFLTANNDPQTEIQCLQAGAVDYITKPFVIEVLRSRISRTLELEELRRNLEEKVEEKTKRISYIQNMTVLGMATMVESRDNSTGGHIRRSGDVVRIFTRHLLETGYLCNGDYIDKIIRAAPMHDLGKIAVDDQVLRKNGRFTDEEYREMRKHSAEGAKVIEKMLRGVDEDEFVDIAVNIARYHHERWDGNGYPDGIAGTQIPLEARIMALADVFDTLASKRCYKPALSYERSFSIIEESLGSQFDPELGKLFLECREKLTSLYDSYGADA